MADRKAGFTRSVISGTGAATSGLGVSETVWEVGAAGEKEAILALAGATVLGVTCCVWFEQPAAMNKTTKTTSTLAFFIAISSSLSFKGLFFLLLRLALLRSSVSL